ncbi:hypothetical protein [Rhizobacter sp. Root1221]|uniref:hypothetical protein n=1 Tax=Rhizobacter sp. Root1221 TaxID=1736433 RepID=UPI0006FD0693|nr:hypothetical protein [Rhizobacter sp. Root1221]KQV87950.1 hypothetical protein ASC87_28960 [Rhizobacter sp. Root1221]
MQTTLTIKDLSATHELDGKTMSAVRGGQDNQANGTSQLNAQGMATLANVGNGSLVLGPVTIQSDNAFTQDARNTSYSSNVDLASIGRGFPFSV